MSGRPGYRLYKPYSPGDHYPTPPGIPHEIPGATRVMNHAILLAETLQVPHADYLEMDREVHMVARDFPGEHDEKYQDDDAALIADFLDRLLPRVDEAVVHDTPVDGQAGDALRAADYFEPFGDGQQLMFAIGRIELSRWRRRAEEIRTMARYAAEHGLWIAIAPVSSLWW
jgi:hypothetical protein